MNIKIIFAVFLHAGNGTGSHIMRGISSFIHSGSSGSSEEEDSDDKRNDAVAKQKSTKWRTNVRNKTAHHEKNTVSSSENKDSDEERPGSDAVVTKKSSRRRTHVRKDMVHHRKNTANDSSGKNDSDDERDEYDAVLQQKSSWRHTNVRTDTVHRRKNTFIAINSNQNDSDDVRNGYGNVIQQKSAGWHTDVRNDTTHRKKNAFSGSSSDKNDSDSVRKRYGTVSQQKSTRRTKKVHQNAFDGSSRDENDSDDAKDGYGAVLQQKSRHTKRVWKNVSDGSSSCQNDSDDQRDVSQQNGAMLSGSSQILRNLAISPRSRDKIMATLTDKTKHSGNRHEKHRSKKGPRQDNDTHVHQKLSTRRNTPRRCRDNSRMHGERRRSKRQRRDVSYTEKSSCSECSSSPSSSSRAYSTCCSMSEKEVHAVEKPRKEKQQVRKNVAKKSTGPHAQKRKRARRISSSTDSDGHSNKRHTTRVLSMDYDKHSHVGHASNKRSKNKHNGEEAVIISSDEEENNSNKYRKDACKIRITGMVHEKSHSRRIELVMQEKRNAGMKHKNKLAGNPVNRKRNCAKKSTANRKFRKNSASQKSHVVRSDEDDVIDTTGDVRRKKKGGVTRKLGRAPVAPLLQQFNNREIFRYLHRRKSNSGCSACCSSKSCTCSSSSSSSSSRRMPEHHKRKHVGAKRNSVQAFVDEAMAQKPAGRSELYLGRSKDNHYYQDHNPGTNDPLPRKGDTELNSVQAFDSGSAAQVPTGYREPFQGGRDHHPGANDPSAINKSKGLAGLGKLKIRKDILDRIKGSMSGERRKFRNTIVTDEEEESYFKENDESRKSDDTEDKSMFRHQTENHKPRKSNDTEKQSEFKDKSVRLVRSRTVSRISSCSDTSTSSGSESDGVTVLD